MNKIHFITYSDDNNKGQYKNMHLTKKRLLNEAKKSGFFDSIKGYNYYNLSNDFIKKYNKILIQPRGAGYWCWKIEIIEQRLNEIDNGDFLIYSDCGCSINPDGKDRLNEYKNMLNISEFGIIYNEMDNDYHQLKKWSTKEIFKYFKEDVNSELGKRRGCTPGVLIMQKKPHLYKIINAFKQLIEHDQYLITDKYNNNPQCSEFIENRHDQTIFTFLFIKFGAIHINGDEINSHVEYVNGKKKRVYNKKSPFWATRIRKI